MNNSKFIDKTYATHEFTEGGEKQLNVINITKYKLIYKHHLIHGITEEYSWNEPEKTKFRVCELGSFLPTLD